MYKKNFITVLACVLILFSSSCQLLDFLNVEGSIVFISNRDDSSEKDKKFDIYIMNPDGTDVIRLTETEENESDPKISPDGKKIIFTKKNDIFIMNIDGGEVINLTESSDDESNPSWSPDGKKIAYQVNKNNNTDLYIMNIDGTEVSQLTTHEAFDGEPSWAPDGKQIAFISWRKSCSTTPEIFTINIDGSEEKCITSSDDYLGSPSWSPDGKSILFTSWSGKPDVHYSSILSTMVGVKYMMTSSNVTDMKIDIGTSRIEILNLSDNGITTISDTSSSNWAPSFSNNGGRIVYVSKIDGVVDLFIMDINGENIINVTNNSGDDAFPSW